MQIRQRIAIAVGLVGAFFALSCSSALAWSPAGERTFESYNLTVNMQGTQVSCQLTLETTLDEGGANKGTVNSGSSQYCVGPVNCEVTMSVEETPWDLTGDFGSNTVTFEDATLRIQWSGKNCVYNQLYWVASGTLEADYSIYSSLGTLTFTNDALPITESNSKPFVGVPLWINGDLATENAPQLEE